MRETRTDAKALADMLQTFAVQIAYANEFNIRMRLIDGYKCGSEVQADHSNTYFAHSSFSAKACACHLFYTIAFEKKYHWPFMCVKAEAARFRPQDHVQSWCAARVRSIGSPGAGRFYA